MKQAQVITTILVYRNEAKVILRALALYKKKLESIPSTKINTMKEYEMVICLISKLKREKKPSEK